MKNILKQNKKKYKFLFIVSIFKIILNFFINNYFRP
jgi:hypothetical protein